MGTGGPDYGVCDHYLGEKGEAYLAWQDAGGVLDGEIESRKFQRLIRPGDTVVDFGCGAGNLLRALRCTRRIGVEANPAALARCREAGIEAHADLAEVPDGIADVVVSNHALEHVPAPIEALRQLRTKLKPRGRLCLVLPIDDWRATRRYDPGDKNRHLYTWTPQLLGNALSEAGFRVRSSDVWIRTHAWPKGHQFLYRHLPEPLFDLACRLYSMLLRRRELAAVLEAP